MVSKTLRTHPLLLQHLLERSLSALKLLLQQGDLATLEQTGNHKHILVSKKGD